VEIVALRGLAPQATAQCLLEGCPAVKEFRRCTRRICRSATNATRFNDALFMICATAGF
jgi:hypothetical protein